jgi:hypothetical protein
MTGTDEIDAAAKRRPPSRPGAEIPSSCGSWSSPPSLPSSVSEQLGGESVDLPKRVFDIALIAAYRVGASSLFRGGFAPARAEASPTQSTAQGR